MIGVLIQGIIITIKDIVLKKFVKILKLEEMKEKVMDVEILVFMIQQ
jgi:tartrate dehydratase beta subunit/fumarate hydratase class I family protein